MECVECLYFDNISERCTLRDNCVYDEESFPELDKVLYSNRGPYIEEELPF